jgi:hypothetical protein
MAESRNKVRGIGLPFDPQYSSCSNIKPKDFMEVDNAKTNYKILIENLTHYMLKILS